VKGNNLILRKIKTIRDTAFKNLQQLYEFEFSPITGNETDSTGCYSQKKLEKMWSENGYDLYVMYKDKIPVGFTVVNLSSMLNGDKETRDIAEFFVMPLYRRKGYGKWMVFRIFDMYKGKWEIRELESAKAAYKFWTSTIKEFTNDNYKELKNYDEHWHEYLFVQQFVV
jgi:predicted acetyltransferase